MEAPRGLASDRRPHRYAARRRTKTITIVHDRSTRNRVSTATATPATRRPSRRAPRLDPPGAEALAAPIQPGRAPGHVGGHRRRQPRHQKAGQGHQFGEQAVDDLPSGFPGLSDVHDHVLHRPDGRSDQQPSEKDPGPELEQRPSAIDGARPAGRPAERGSPRFQRDELVHESNRVLRCGQSIGPEHHDLAEVVREIHVEPRLDELPGLIGGAGACDLLRRGQRHGPAEELLDEAFGKRKATIDQRDRIQGHGTLLDGHRRSSLAPEHGHYSFVGGATDPLP